MKCLHSVHVYVCVCPYILVGWSEQYREASLEMYVYMCMCMCVYACVYKCARKIICVRVCMYNCVYIYVVGWSEWCRAESTPPCSIKAFDRPCDNAIWWKGKLLSNALLQHGMCCSVLQFVAMWCIVLQCVAVCCSVLQCVSMCCSVNCFWRHAMKEKCIRCFIVK